MKIINKEYKTIFVSKKLWKANNSVSGYMFKLN